MDTRTYGVPAAKLDWLVKARATPRTTCTHTTRDIAFDGRTSKSGLASLGLALVSSMCARIDPSLLSSSLRPLNALDQFSFWI